MPFRTIPNFLISLGLLALPFSLLFWLVPGHTPLTRGNDYVVQTIQNQMAIAYSLNLNVFPLYILGFTFDHSIVTLTLGQLFHPITYQSILTPGYWHEHAPSINTIYRLLSLGITQWFLLPLAALAARAHPDVGHPFRNCSFFSLVRKLV